MHILYTTLSGNSKRFCDKICNGATEITEANCFNILSEPYIIIIPSYEDVTPMEECIQDLLETGDNLDYCVGVMGSGNMNFEGFGLYCITAKRLSEQYDLNVLRRFELFGDKNDVDFSKGLINYIDNYQLLPNEKWSEVGIKFMSKELVKGNV